MPSAAVPTTPIPTQTAYAVPTGSDFMARPSSQTLITMATMVATVGHSREALGVLHADGPADLEQAGDEENEPVHGLLGIAGSSPCRTAATGSSPPRPERGAPDAHRRRSPAPGMQYAKGRATACLRIGDRWANFDREQAHSEGS